VHPRVRVHRDGEHYLIEVRGAVAIANAIAYLSELLGSYRYCFGYVKNNNLMKHWLMLAQTANTGAIAGGVSDPRERR
jgi:hypothetical protein